MKTKTFVLPHRELVAFLIEQQDDRPVARWVHGGSACPEREKSVQLGRNVTGTSLDTTSKRTQLCG
jgi:hypothetical protein